MSSPSEYEVHASIVGWLDYALPQGSLVHHSPNEGRHHVRYRTKLKKLGLQAGYWFDPAWGPIYFEVKSAKGRLTKQQKIMLVLLDKAGGHCSTVRSIDETRAFLAQRIELRV